MAGLADLDISGQQALNEHFLGEILHRAAQGDQTVAHDGHVGRDLEHLRQAVGDVDHADALALEVLDHLEEGLHLAEGQRAGGLVQDQEPRFAHHAAQDLHQLLLGNGQGAGLALQVERKAQLFHVFLQALFELRLVFMKAHQHVFQHRHVGKQHRLLRHQIDALCQRGGGLAQPDGLSVHENFALVKIIDAHDDLHQGALAGAVAADEGDDFAFLDIHIDALEHHVGAEGLGDPPDRHQDAGSFVHSFTHSRDLHTELQMFLPCRFCSIAMILCFSSFVNVSTKKNFAAIRRGRRVCPFSPRPESAI